MTDRLTLTRAFEGCGTIRGENTMTLIWLLLDAARRGSGLATQRGVCARRSLPAGMNSAGLVTAIVIALTLGLVAAFPAFAGEQTVSEATPAFDWDLYHDRQDACREKDRIAAQCTQGHCDELALRQAQRACSAFGPLAASGDDTRALVHAIRTRFDSD
jgi:hypothetical protein